MTRNDKQIGARYLFGRHEAVAEGPRHGHYRIVPAGEAPNIEARALVATRLIDTLGKNTPAILSGMGSEPFRFNEQVHGILESSGLSDIVRTAHPEHPLSLYGFFADNYEDIDDDPRFATYCDAMLAGDDALKKNPKLGVAAARAMALHDYQTPEI